MTGTNITATPEKSFTFRTAADFENTLIRQTMEREGRWVKFWNDSFIAVLADPRTGQIAGWARHWPSPQGRHFILNVTIDDKFRGQGLGLALISRMIGSQPGIERWFLDCMPDLENYYRRIGFVRKTHDDCPELVDAEDPPDIICMMCTRGSFRPFAVK